MNRSLLFFGIPVLAAALLAGGLASGGLYRWEQAVRLASLPTAAPPVPEVSPTPVAAESEPTAAPADGAGDAAAGQTVYAQLCDACHPGGGAGLGPPLTGPAFLGKYADDAPLIAILRGGTTGMPGFPSSRISEPQMANLIAFIRSLGNPAASGPAPTEVPVLGQMTWTGSYARDIQPIFDDYCVRCHGAALAENGLRLDSYNGVMQGTRGGAVVSPGVAGGSTLVWVIQGLAAPELRMPHADRPLSPNRIQNIVLWIDAGAPDN